MRLSFMEFWNFKAVKPTSSVQIIHLTSSYHVKWWIHNSMAVAWKFNVEWDGASSVDIGHHCATLDWVDPPLFPLQATQRASMNPVAAYPGNQTGLYWPMPMEWFPKKTKKLWIPKLFDIVLTLKRESDLVHNSGSKCQENPLHNRDPRTCHSNEEEIQQQFE